MFLQKEHAGRSHGERREKRKGERGEIEEREEEGGRQTDTGNSKETVSISIEKN